jgi:hypothetical protein
MLSVPRTRLGSIARISVVEPSGQESARLARIGRHRLRDGVGTARKGATIVSAAAIGRRHNFGITDVPMRPVIHVAQAIGPRVPVWDIAESFGEDTNLLVTNIDHGRDLAKRSGQRSVALMRGQACVTVRASWATPSVMRSLRRCPKAPPFPISKWPRWSTLAAHLIVPRGTTSVSLCRPSARFAITIPARTSGDQFSRFTSLSIDGQRFRDPHLLQQVH